MWYIVFEAGEDTWQVSCGGTLTGAQRRATREARTVETTGVLRVVHEHGGTYARRDVMPHGRLGRWVRLRK